MNLAYKKILGKFTKVLGFGKTPPPCWKNSQIISFFLYESVPKLPPTWPYSQFWETETVAWEKRASKGTVSRTQPGVRCQMLGCFKFWGWHPVRSTVHCPLIVSRESFPGVCSYLCSVLGSSHDESVMTGAAGPARISSVSASQFLRQGGH